MSNTRPMSRLEMAGMVLRFSAKPGESGRGGDYLKALLNRLEYDLKDEIESINNKTIGDMKIRPLRWVRAKAVHSDDPFQLENDYGFQAGEFSLRGELSTSGTFGFIGYELRPQFNIYRDSQNDDQADLHSGYLVIWLKNLEIEVGKDSLWWGPGRHGSWLLTNNAPAFELIKLSNAVTTVPPGPLKFLGDTKLTAFLGRLSEQEISYINNSVRVTEEKNPLFAGFRLDFSPSRYIEIGGAQTIEFIDRGGRGYTLDYIRRTFIASWENNEEEGTSGPVANRITSADLTIKIDGQHDFMKYAGLEGMKIYWEVGGETMARDSTTKIPRFSNTSNIFGLYLDTGKTDFRAEYASTYDAPTPWYKHYQFTEEGYRNKGFILGHHMGGHSRDTFLSLSHPLSDSMATTLSFEREEHKDGPVFKEDAYGFSIDAFSKRGGKVTISYEYRDGDNSESINQVWAAEGLYRF